MPLGAGGPIGGVAAADDGPVPKAGVSAALQDRVDRVIGRATLDLLEKHPAGQKLSDYERRSLGRDLLTTIGHHLESAGYPGTGAAIIKARQEISL